MTGFHLLLPPLLLLAAPRASEDAAAATSLRYWIRVNNTRGVGLRIAHSLFVKEVIASSPAFGKIQAGDKIIGSSFKSVVASLKTVDETEHVELQLARPGTAISDEN